MDATDEHERAIELLQNLGLKEYEAKCYVALTRLPSATAKEVSELSDVPRTRVYDATRVLEAQGLVEVHHDSPQQFRAVPVEEAIETLRDKYESRFDALKGSLSDLDPVEFEESSSDHEVWGLSGSEAITNRTVSLIGDAGGEVVLVVGSERALSEDLFDALRDATDRGVEVVVGALTEAVRDALQDAVPDAEVFVSGLEWLRGPETEDDETAIGRMLLVDRSTILVSTVEPDTGHERAVFGRGFNNGLVVIVRRLMATGLAEGAGD